MLKKWFALSDQGAKDLRHAILAVAFNNLALMFPIGLMIALLGEILLILSGDHTQYPNLLYYSVFSIVLLIIIFITNRLEYRKTYISSFQESERRRITLAEKLRRLPLSFFGKRDLSDLTTTIMTDCNELELRFSGAIPKLFGSILSIVIFTTALFFIEWRMALALFMVFPVATALTLIGKKLGDRLGNKRLAVRIEGSDAIQEYLEGIREIKAWNQTDTFLTQLQFKMQELARWNMKLEVGIGLFILGSQMILRIGFALVVLTGATLFMQEEIPLIIYLVFLFAASRVYEPLGGVLMQLAEVFNTQLQVARLKEIERTPELPGTLEPTMQTFDVTFNNVSFSYNDQTSVLKDVSFTARQGEVTALVGPSGSGKSTLAKLAARFWDPTEGNILVGGQNIAEVDAEKLLKNYSIVFQDVVLFNASLLDNIRIGKKDATDEEVLAAAKAAMCDDFIGRLKDGYNTVIGENGQTLSGGERQRISIARALLKDAPIVILDEATASLDVENETKVQIALSKLIRNKTVLIIAHRMRTIQKAHQVVVLKDGRLVENGTPEQLYKQHGLYHRLVTLQQQTNAWTLQESD